MNGNSTISKEMSARAAKRYPRWRMVFALVLALTIGSAGQIPPAQAAPHAANWQLFLSITGAPSDPICIGDKGDLTVRILGDKVDDSETDALTPKIHLLGISVYGGVVGDYGIVTLSPSTAVISASNDPPDSARFTFVAKKAGQVSLDFDAQVNTSWFGPFSSPESGTVKQSVNIKVVQCKYKVMTVWKHNDVIYHTTGSSDQVLMTRDESGSFTGSGTMHWVYAYVGKTCKMQASASPSPVKLKGTLDDDGGQFTVAVTFGASTIPSSVSCPGASAGATRTGTLDPLTISVASSGGTFTKSLAGGTATIVVVPLDK